MKQRILFFLGGLAGFLFVIQSLCAHQVENPDEKLLRQAGIGTDGNSLLVFLRGCPKFEATDAEQIQRLIRHLGSENSAQREQASRELTACGQAALAPLRKALESNDAEVVRRARACIQDIEVYTNRELCVAVLRLVQKVRPAEAVPALLEALNHPDALVRKEAYDALCQLAGPKDQPDILKAAKDKRPYVRAGAIGLGYKFKDQPKVFTPILLEAIRDENVAVRRQAAMSLQHFGFEEGVVLALAEALKDKDATPPSEVSVPKAAACSLQTLGSLARPAIPALMEISKEGHERNRSAATLAFGYLGAKDKEIHPTVVPFLARLLEDKNQPVANRKAAAAALGMVGPDAKAAVPSLREVLKGEDVEDPEIRFGIHNSVLAALGRIGPMAQAAVPDIVAILQDNVRNRDDRLMAAEALRAFGPAAQPAVSALTKALKDKDYQVRLMTAQALGAIGPEAKDAVPNLIEAVNDERTIITEAAITALGAIGPAAEPAVPALTEALKHISNEVRLSSAEALQKIQRKPE